MKHVLLILLTSLLTAALLGYTLKTNAKAPLKAAEYAHCSAIDVRETAKLEASTKQFAALYKDPLYFGAERPERETSII